MKSQAASALFLFISFCLLHGSPPAGRSHRIENVPFYYDSSHLCGPASLAGVLGFWGNRSDPDALRKELYLEKLKGSLPMDLVQAARKRGMKADMKSLTLPELKEEIQRGRPVIALLNLGFRFFPRGHFVVVTGYDDERKGLYANSGKKEGKFFRYRSFLKKWDRTDRTALLVAPPLEGLDPSNVRP